MNELVSVIIPTYKRSIDVLSRAVNSVKIQTYQNIEIIVIDDSPDSYEKRVEVEKYMKSISSEKVIYLKNKQNIGGSLSRNRGIVAANGQYITFLDDDDEYMPQKVEKQLSFMIDNTCDLSFSDMVMYDSNEKVVDYREYSNIVSFENNELLKYHLMKHLTGTPTFMFKADKLREINGFDDAKMGQEFYIMLKAIESGLKIRYLKGCYIKVYKHLDGGISQGMNKIIGEKRLYKFKKNYFPILSVREKIFIRFRHWAVMVVAYKRNKMYFKMCGSGITAFVSSPWDFFKEVSKYIRKVVKYNKEI